MTPRSEAPRVTVRFSSVVLLRGVNPYVLVRADRARRLRATGRRPIPVRLWLNGADRRPWRTNLMPVGDGSYYLYLHGPARQQAAVQVGDRVRCELEYDARYRNGPQHRMPSALRAALVAEPTAARNWTDLPPSRKKEVLRYLAGLQGAEVRARNIARVLAALSGRRVRFLGRDWVDGR